MLYVHLEVAKQALDKGGRRKRQAPILNNLNDLQQVGNANVEDNAIAELSKTRMIQIRCCICRPDPNVIPCTLYLFHQVALVECLKTLFVNFKF